MLLLFPVSYQAIRTYSVPNTETTHTSKVTKVDGDNVFVNNGIHSYYVMFSTSQQFQVGQTITYSCSYQYQSKNSTFTLYLTSNQTQYYCYSDSATIEKPPINTARNDIYSELINNQQNIFASVSLEMIYGVQSTSYPNISTSISNLGVNQLFVLSGFHIGLIFIGVGFITKFFTSNNNLKFVIGSLFSFWFLYMTYFPYAAIRAWLFRNIHFINKRAGYGLQTTESLSVVLLIFLVLNPSSILTASLVMSFGLTYFLIWIMEMRISKIRKILIIPFILWIASIPVLTSFDNTYNIITPFATIILTPLITLAYPIVIVLLPFKNLWVLGYGIIFILYGIFFLLLHMSYYFTITYHSYYFIIINFVILYYSIKLTSIYKLERFFIPEIYSLSILLLLVII